jgi:hypothetical protein
MNHISNHHIVKKYDNKKLFSSKVLKKRRPLSGVTRQIGTIIINN